MRKFRGLRIFQKCYIVRLEFKFQKQYFHLIYWVIDWPTKVEKATAASRFVLGRNISVELACAINMLTYDFIFKYALRFCKSERVITGKVVDGCLCVSDCYLALLITDPILPVSFCASFSNFVALAYVFYSVCLPLEGSV